MSVKDFGVSNGVPVKQITIKPKLPERLSKGPNAKVWQDVRAVFVSYGAALQELWVPGKTDTEGNKKDELALADIVLGYDNLKGYEKNVPYLGTIVGRVAGRIVNGRFSNPIDLDPSISPIYKVPKNLKNKHCLHGGFTGLSYRPWEIAEVRSDSVKFTVLSPDGDDGFPGNLTTFVTYKLVINEHDAIEVHIDYFASITDGICPINLTNHSYFNLCGHKAGPNAMDRHVVLLQADKMCELEDELIPTGYMQPVGTVKGTDLRKAMPLKDSLTMIHPPPFQGFDDFYAFKCLPKDEPRIVVTEEVSGRKLEMFTDQNGVQFYSGNFLDPKIDPVGKDNFAYPQHSGLCMEAQNYPDGCNRNNFPREFVTPQKPYTQKTHYTISF